HHGILRPLLLYRACGLPARARTAVLAGPVFDELRQSKAPRDDGPRRVKGLGPGAHVGLRPPARGSGAAAVFCRDDDMSPLPLLPVTTVGSWPRPPELLRAQRLKQTGRLSAEAFERQADVAVLEVVRLQEQAGVDIVTDGEQRRDNFYSFVAEKLAGTQL